MSVTRRYFWLAVASAASAGVLILLGGAVAFMGAAKSIPDWPTSFGSVAPPPEAGAFVEYLHRIFAVLTAILVVGTAVTGVRRFRSVPWLAVPPAVSVVLLAVVATLGAIVVLASIPPALAAVDLGSALLVLALMVTSALASGVAGANPRLVSIRLSFRDPFARLALAACAVLYVVLATTLSVGTPAPANSLGLPMWSRLASGEPGWLEQAHLALSGAAGVLVAALAALGWRRRRTETASLCLATAVVVLYAAGTLTGELAAARGLPWLLMGIRVVTTAAMWASAAALVVLEGLRGAAPQGAGGARRMKDLMSMTRPVVTLLLLVAAYAGMIAAGRGVPPLGLTLATLGALALAAGGAQALNQVMERDLDAGMERTARRPLPAGRLSPAEGAAWGLGLCLASLLLMADLVGALAAALTALGIGWYLLVYTAALKRRSPSSVVVGGVAGALMPLVGSAAVSGGLGTTAILVSAVVFLWTPPHFWSLAVLRVADYARAGVPALPVVKGEGPVRFRILASSAVLVAATVGVSIYESARPAFLVAAGALGAFLLYRAWTMWRRGGELAAARMYRFSSIYLGLLLTALATEQLM